MTLCFILRRVYTIHKKLLSASKRYVQKTGKGGGYIWDIIVNTISQTTSKLVVDCCYSNSYCYPPLLYRAQFMHDSIHRFFHPNTSIWTEINTNITLESNIKWRRNKTDWNPGLIFQKIIVWLLLLYWNCYRLFTIKDVIRPVFTMI